jgi:hypothetical protein
MFWANSQHLFSKQINLLVRPLTLASDIMAKYGLDSYHSSYLKVSDDLCKLREPQESG